MRESAKAATDLQQQDLLLLSLQLVSPRQDDVRF